MTATKTLTPPEIGELVGLRAEAMVTGNHVKFRARVLEMHLNGVSYSTIGAPLGFLPNRLRKMVEKNDWGNWGKV